MVLGTSKQSAPFYQDLELQLIIRCFKYRFYEIRPAWLTDNQEIDYETTTVDEKFKGTEVSRASVADFVIKLIADPTLNVRQSIGLDKPGTDGDKPSWM